MPWGFWKGDAARGAEGAAHKGKCPELGPYRRGPIAARGWQLPTPPALTHPLLPCARPPARQGALRPPPPAAGRAGPGRAPPQQRGLSRADRAGAMGKKHKKHKSDKHPYEGGSLRGWAGRGRQAARPEADAGPGAPSGARPAPPGPAPGLFGRSGERGPRSARGPGDGRWAAGSALRGGEAAAGTGNEEVVRWGRGAIAGVIEDGTVFYLVLTQPVSLPV